MVVTWDNWGTVPEDDPFDDEGEVELHEHPAKIVTREEWGAQEPTSPPEEMTDFPLPYLVAMHTRTRPCKNKEDCKKAVREIQKRYMDQGESDIPYNYLIDMEGNIYIGRGPSAVAMAFPEDDKRLGKVNGKVIVLGYIGNGGVEPPDELIFGSASLVSLLFEDQYIDEDNKMMWYDLPIKGLPQEEVDEDEMDFEDKLKKLQTDYNRSMLASNEPENMENEDFYE